MNRAFPLESSFFDECTVFAFRITLPEDVLSLEKTFDGFKEISPRLIVSEERSSKGVLHHHGLVTIPGLTKEGLRECIRTIYPDATGNKNIYTALAEKKKQLLKYTLKEGKFLQQGFSTEFIQAALTLSSSKEGMDTAFTNLYDSLFLGQITMSVYKREYIKLKIIHGQNLYGNHLQAYFTTVAFKLVYKIKPDDFDAVVDQYITRMEDGRTEFYISMDEDPKHYLELN